MILQGQPRSGLTRPGWALVLGGLVLLPLMPTLARSEPAGDTPARGGDDGATTLERVLSSKACASCHGPQMKKSDKGEASDLHDRIVKLLDEMEKQRAQLKKTEAALKSALDKFESATQPKAKGKAPATTPREKQLEERLEKLTKELEALRREVRRRDVSFGRGAPPLTGTKHYTHKRQITIPVNWSEGSGLKRMGLFVRVEGETKYRFVRMLSAGTKSANYTAPKDGTYAFNLFIPEGEDAPRTREDPATPALTVVVDTKPPVIELEWSGGRGMRALAVQWTVTDENPLENHVKLEVRKANQTTWVDKTMSASTKGSTTLLGEKDIAEFRLTAYDKAGNRAVVRRWVNQDD